MSKFRWPAHFAILNNDCLWVMDEVQLMGPGLQTSAQLEAFRSRMGTVGNHFTIWMSATMDLTGINTVDHPLDMNYVRTLRLSSEDKVNMQVSSILEAKKTVRVSPVNLEKDEKKNGKAIAARIKEIHEPESLTLVIVNTVSRARAIFSELERMGDKTPIVLLHSHYRPSDRSLQYERIKQEDDLIVVSTQVVEAGADISSKNMITDLAPWPSMVQRFGRCNRRGEHSEATIEWLDPGIELDPKGVLPYEVDDLSHSRELIMNQSDGSPSAISRLSAQRPSKILPVIRRKDLVDLFDTTPDLLGNELDISRFIRANDNKDVFVFWRTIIDGTPNVTAAPSPEELCSVPIGDISKFVDKNDAWIWDHVVGKWSKILQGEARSVRPGQIILLDREKGGYSASRGWTGSEKDIPTAIENREGLRSDSLNSDAWSDTGWITLMDHTEHVIKEVEGLGTVIPPEHMDVLKEAAKWHDIGKAHEAFQNMILMDEGRRDAVWGKAPRQNGAQFFTTSKEGRKILRPYFRHELASALAYMARQGRSPTNDLIAYLIAAHHGKVRVTLRSVPSENGPDTSTLFARGVWDGDVISFPDMIGTDIILDLTPIRLGTSSWSNMSIRLRDRIDMGPFRLAYLETMLRIADWRASKKEAMA